MRVLSPPIARPELEKSIARLAESSLVFRDYGAEAPGCCGAGLNHHLGVSDAQDLWVFASVDHPPVESLRDYFRSSDDRIGCVEFILEDPPVQDREAITELMFRLHDALHRGAASWRDDVERIVAQAEFPTPRSVVDFFPEAPAAWQELHVKMNHGFELSANTCMIPSVWKAYERDSIDGALEALYAPRYPGLLVGYSLVATDTIPMLRWNVDWPLSRRGDDPPFRRERIEGDFPGETVPDHAVLRIYQLMKRSDDFLHAPPVDGRPTVRLQVGGRTQEEAIANWHHCAKALRRRRKQLEIPDVSPVEQAESVEREPRILREGIEGCDHCLQTSAQEARLVWVAFSEEQVELLIDEGRALFVSACRRCNQACLGLYYPAPDASGKNDASFSKYFPIGAAEVRSLSSLKKADILSAVHRLARNRRRLDIYFPPTRERFRSFSSITAEWTTSALGLPESFERWVEGEGSAS